MKKHRTRKSSMYKKIFCYLFTFSFFLWGGFYEAISALYSICGIIFIFWQIKKTGKLKLPTGKAFYCLCLLLICMIFSVFFAVDPGLAVLGFIKFFPLSLFVVVAYQLEAAQRDDCIQLLPGVASVMVLLSTVLYFTTLKDYYFTAERMGGPLQYPNVFALVMLLAIMVLMDKELLGNRELIQVVICTAGILMSGSRSIFLLFVMYLLYVFIWKKPMRKWVAALTGSIVLLAVLGGIILGHVQNFARFSTAYTHTSTFWGRLLYYQDALEIVKDHPFGLGYKGYYFIQGSYASGNYVTMFVHNELLQTILDFGILAGVLLIIMVIISFASKRLTFNKKKMLAVCVMHGLFDFDLQFIAIDFVILLLMDFGEARTVGVSVKVKVVVFLLLIASIYTMVFLGLGAMGKNNVALKLYPWLTFAELNQISEETVRENKERIADHILMRNEYCSAVYRMKSALSAETGKLESMIYYAGKSIELDKYNAENYELYIEGLSRALEKAVQTGNTTEIDYYLKAIISVERQIQDTEQSSSLLAFKIKDSPKIILQEQYLTYIEKMKQIQKQREV